MRELFIGLFFLTLSGCSFKKFYPLAGSVLGGSAGSLGGPITGGLGAGAGWTVGELAKDDEALQETKTELADAKETIEALTTGDVEALLQLEREKQKGFLANLEDSIYSLLKIAVIVIGFLVLTPIIYTRLKCRKTLEMLGIADEKLGRSK